MTDKRPFVRKGCELKFTLLAIGALVAAILGVVVATLPSFADATPTPTPCLGACAGEAYSTVKVHLLGYHTASKVSVPLDDGVTVSPNVQVATAYDQSYSIDYQLAFDDENGTTVPTAYTKRTTISQSTLGDGWDRWTLDLSALGLGYGTYTLTAIARGTGQSTDVITFRYVPVHAKYISADENGNPTFNITANASAYITNLKYKVYRQNTSTPVASTIPFQGGSLEDDVYEGQVTLPLDGFSGVTTNTYSVDFEGVATSTALGYVFTTKFAYTAPSSSSSDTPDMNGEGDAALLVAAGAAVAAASKRRNNG